MTRFKRAIVGFMLIANLGLYSAFALWVMVDGGLPDLVAVEPVEARGLAKAALSPTPTLLPLASPSAVATRVPTPGWTPPPVVLAPLPTQAPPSASPPEASGPGASPTTEFATPAQVASPAVGPIQPAELPPSASVTGVIGHRQALPLSCESRSAADWAAFFGVTFDELDFLHSLPLSDDPDRGFVGDVNGEWGNVPPLPYGVHAAPVARLLRQYGIPAEAHRYMDWNDVRAEVAAGRPVIVWVTGHVEAGEGVVYTAGDGRQTIVARYEHTVIVVGYDEDGVVVVDGARTYHRSLERFLASWGALRNMGITAAP